ncbi:MAG: CAF17-like 4Fe-4S cluster assembly/insertion protein YgfZ [Hyphomicrobiales bacterium]
MPEQPFSPSLRPERSVLRIDGPEAIHFLHNLLTADIEGLAAGAAAYTALLTPQGKMLFDFFIVRDGDGFVIDCAASQKADLVKRLGFYKLRAKVTISDLTDREVGVSPEKPATGLAFSDPRDAAMGWRVIAPAGTLPRGSGYDAARIRHGLADTDADLGSGEYFPHEANLDQLGAVSFEKGCYVGQEVVSRMEHRATARSRILPVHLDGAAPVKGSDIVSGGKIVGTLLSSQGPDALAVMRLDRLAEAQAPLLTAGVGTRVIKPRWARYDVPGAGDGD